jgi:exopolysaccharide production protein ExoY
VFFAYERVGRNGITFRCLKFHTMVVGAEECLGEYLKYRPEAAEEWKTQRKLTFDRRITTLGAFLRKTSLDELPQLWNVLVGQKYRRLGAGQTGRDL